MAQEGAGILAKQSGMSELRQVLVRLPAYVRLAWALWRDHRLTPGQRAIIALAAGYSVSPLDVIPGLIPVVGQLDDLFVLLAAIRRVLRRLPTTVRDEHLRAAGVLLDEVDADYRRVRNALGHVVGRTVRFGGRAGMAAILLGGRAVSLGMRTGAFLARSGFRLLTGALRRCAGRAAPG